MRPNNGLNRKDKWNRQLRMPRIIRALLHNPQSAVTVVLPKVPKLNTRDAHHASKFFTVVSTAKEITGERVIRLSARLSLLMQSEES